MSAGGVSVSGVKNRSADSAVGYDLEVPRAHNGTLSTRTNNTEGTITLSGGHPVTTAMVVDLYWTGGTRRAVVVGTVSGTSVPISGGSADTQPSV